MKRIPFLRGTLAAFILCYLLMMNLPAQSAATRELQVEFRWLNFATSGTAPLHHVTILRDGQPVRVFTAQIAPDHPGWWTALDAGPWIGSTVEIRVEDAAQNPALLSSIEATAEPCELGPELYREPLRPQFHFSARRGWMNDPNGLVFCDGQYHLFFQHNPFTWSNASKHWGHAISADLVHWHEVGEALYPDAEGEMYSGSAVVDRTNSSGLVAGAKTPLVLVYTTAGHGSTQCLASTEDGVTFTKFPGNPVIPKIVGTNRDPKVFWHEPTHRWIMALYVGMVNPTQPAKAGEFHDRHSIHLYTSRNLRDWQQTDIVEGGAGKEDRFLFECPDLFPLPVDGHANDVKWVIQGGSGEYVVGNFDGEKFTRESPRQRNRFGGDFYAAQTFNNLPGNRVVQIGWMRAPTPGMPFNQCLSIPLDLSLRTTGTEVQLAYAPTDELKNLRREPIVIAPGILTQGENALSAVKSESWDMEAELNPGTAKRVVFSFRGVDVVYDVARGTLRCKGIVAPVPLDHGLLRLRILLDRTTLDIFAADGSVYLPVAILPEASCQLCSLTVPDGSAEIMSLKIYPLQSAWAP